MIPVSLQTFFTEHGLLVQIVGTAIVVFAIGRSAKRARPKVLDGWTHSPYSGALKALSLLGAAFMTAAILYNGQSIFRQGWLTPVFLLIAAAAYLFAYEVLFATLRWNATEVEVRRFPFGPRTLQFQDVVSIKLHRSSESVTLTSQTGARLWFPYGYRVGASELFTRILARNAATAATHSCEERDTQ